jgi:diacylglycerol kinase family enzyme
VKSFGAPEAKMDDGLLDFTAIMHSPGFSPSELANELKEPMNPNNRFAAYRQLAEFVIESDQELNCNLDGEPVRKRKLKFSVRPGQLQVAY